MTFHSSMAPWRAPLRLTRRPIDERPAVPAAAPAPRPPASVLVVGIQHARMLAELAAQEGMTLEAAMLEQNVTLDVRNTMYTEDARRLVDAPPAGVTVTRVMP